MCKYNVISIELMLPCWCNYKCQYPDTMIGTDSLALDSRARWKSDQESKYQTNVDLIVLNARWETEGSPKLW